MPLQNLDIYIEVSYRAFSISCRIFEGEFYVDDIEGTSALGLNMGESID